MLRKGQFTTFFLCLFMAVLMFPKATAQEVMGSAQEMKVLSFNKLDTDMDARVNHPEKDWNGKTCAIIKVETTQTGFTFDTGTMGITGSENKVGEIWVWVSPGVKKFNLYHPEYGVCRYEIGITVEEASVYSLKLYVGPSAATQSGSGGSAYGAGSGAPTSGSGSSGGGSSRTDDGTSRTDSGSSTLGGGSSDNRNDYSGTGSGVSTETITVNGVSFTMVKVEGGSFAMGATPEQGHDAVDDEKPVHRVTLSSYYIGMTEVTQELWLAVMDSYPSPFTGLNNPVELVSWDACRDFIRKLNSLTGRTFRLPTEAEWEFAARGGNLSKGYKYSGSNVLGDVAWYKENFENSSHPVAQKQPNELGLYDMSGNVWEWCNDRYDDYSLSSQTNPKGPSSGHLRAHRGGGCDRESLDCRVSYRYGTYHAYCFNYLGLRLVLVP